MLTGLAYSHTIVEGIRKTKTSFNRKAKLEIDTFRFLSHLVPVFKLKSSKKD